MSNERVIGINIMRRSVAFFVQKMQYMSEEEGKALVEDVKNPVVPDSWRLDHKGEQRTNAPWHAEKNGRFAEMAYKHVFDGEPIPCVDDQKNVLKEKSLELERLKAMLAEAKLDEDIAKAAAELDEYKKKRKTELKKDGKPQSVDKGGTKKVS